MEIGRMIKIVLMDLKSESLKLEEELERVINSKENTHDKVDTIKSILHKLSINEISLKKFTTMLPNNNDIENENEN